MSLNVIISGADNFITKTKLTHNTIDPGVVVQRAPKTGFRKFTKANYLILSFEVNVWKFTDPQAEYTRLKGLVGNVCQLVIESVNNTYPMIFNNTAQDFYVESVVPVALGIRGEYDICFINFRAINYTQATLLFLIDDLDNFIITDDGQKIEINL